MSWLPVDAWWHCTAPITGGSFSRGASLLESVLDQFDVEHHPRYAPKNGTTFCNTFVNDVTRALACEVAQREWGQKDGRAAIVELDANAMADWLAGPHGRQHGWVSCDEKAARAAADSGYPVVVTWLNVGGIGHVAVGTPAPMGTPQDGLLWVAASGSHNFRRCLVAQSFGRAPVRYFTHA